MYAGSDFYGRAEPLVELGRVVEAEHWFFCRIEGRRPKGKAPFWGHLARSSDDLSSWRIYTQIPDSDERDAAATFRRSLSEADSKRHGHRLSNHGRHDRRPMAKSVLDSSWGLLKTAT